MPSITFSNKTIKFALRNKKLIKDWLLLVGKNEAINLSSLNYIFCNDDFLIRLNQQYLNHNTYTDILTFDYTENGHVEGDIFISIDRVKENSTKFNVSFDIELLRVMVHGLLHLCGYKDKISGQKKKMRDKENQYLQLIVPRGTSIIK